jgi:hypothetical protein
MKGKITDYTIVSEHDHLTLIDKVREQIKSGFEPLGGIQVVAPVLDGAVAPLYAQAMIKRE